MTGRVSVVVPIYNVELYLQECLDSLAAQTLRDVEVVMVDDGSQDGSAAIASAFQEKDGRFRLVRQPNGGLGNARNTGLDVASGEFVMFVDSDDTLPAYALERMLGALDETGSDFATGMVWRIRRKGLEPSQWLAPVFAETRLRTHVTKFHSLVTDRIACNKLWRRTFWDEHACRFPERVLHEDIPIVVPAHFLARSVDALSDPVYYWRARVGTGKSITQRRTDPKSLVDRLTATQQVREFLRGYPVPAALNWYDASLLSDDLMKYLDPLWHSDDSYRKEFLDRVNTLLDDTDPVIFDTLSPLDRRKWDLVRARRMDELLAVLGSERNARRGPAPTRTQRILRRVPEPLRRVVPIGLRRRVLGSGR
jgi:CDP-glycerol glycerophosphotransferase